jgi:hypothetical protein
MKRRIAQSAVLLCLAVLLAAGPSLAAPPASNPGQDRLSEMIAQGWKPMANGVFKRDVGGGQVETFGMGLEGFQYGYEQLRNQYGFLRSEYRKNHDPKLLQTLAVIEQELVRTQNDIQLLESMAASTPPAAGCDFSYGAHSNAFGTTNVQGVQADASAYFNNNCGYTGDTYAYAYARARTGTVTTIHTQTDPRSGSSISSSATAAVAGNEDCYSNSTARASSVDLGIFYSTSSENFSCPPVAYPPTVTVNGLASVSIFGFNCKIVSWTSTVSGGTPAYTNYAWYMNGYLAQNGTGTSYATTFCGDDYTWTDYLDVSLTVTDSAGQNGTGSMNTTIYYSGSGGGGCLVAGDSAIILPCY